jgi:hypothetical protein
MSSLFRRLEALEAQAPTTPGLDLSPEAQAAALARLLARMEAYKSKVAARAGMTAQELAAIEAQEEAEYWRQRAANPAPAVDIGSRFSLRSTLEAALQRRYSEPGIDDDSRVLTTTLVPGLAGPQGGPAANSEPLPPRRRRAKAAEEPPPWRDKRAWCRDYDQETAEASGRFYEPDAV